MTGAVRIALLLALSAGCASGPPSNQSVSIIVSEPNAEVFVDDVSRGTGSMVIALDRDIDHVVTARLGQRESTEKLRSGLSDDSAMFALAGIFFPPLWLFLLDDEANALRPEPLLLVLPPADTP